MASTMAKINKQTATTEDLSDQLQILRHDISALTQTVSEIGKAKGDQAVAAAKAKAEDIKETAADRAETTRLQAMELQGQANTFIRNQPATALGIAAGIGFLVGMMSARK